MAEEATGRRVRFTADFDWKPQPDTTIAYRRGDVAFVRLACAEAAIAKGRAVPAADVPSLPTSLSATIARQGRARKKPARGK